MKIKIYVILITTLTLVLFGCKKEEPTIWAAPPLEIQTEACFSPLCTTLILAHPDDNFFYCDTQKYKVGWWKDGVYLKQGTRLDCVHNGVYHVKVDFLEAGLSRELTYELSDSDDEE